MKFFKHFIFALLLSFVASSAMAQDLTSYFIDSSVESKIHNAAFAPDRGYVTIPLIGGLSFSTNGNLSMGQLFFPIDGDLLPILDTRVSADQALSSLNSVNYFGLENRMAIAGVGKYFKDQKSFWSVDISLRNSSNFALPYELFEFFKTAPEQASISNANIYINSYVEAAFGYSRVVNDKLTLGARVKLLGGLANASLNIDQMDVTLQSDEWNATASGTLDMHMNGASVMSTDGTFGLGDLDAAFSGLAGFGAAIDFGATYDVLDDLQLSLAVNDLGFISWNKNSNIRGTMADQFSFSGIVIDEDGNQVTDTSDLNMDDLIFEQESAQSSTESLQANINLGAEYKLWSDKVGVGAVYSARFWRNETIHNVTTSVNYTPINLFTAAATYAITTNANAFGVGLNFALQHFNIYLATDILTARKSAQFIPIDQSMMNVSLGLAVAIGPDSKR